MTVRPATPDDAERVAELSGQLGYAASTEEISSRMDGLERADHHAVFVAEGDHGRAVGWIHVFLRRGLAIDLQAEIGGLIVDEACRGGGIGRSLVTKAEAWARNNGCTKIGVRANVKRDDAKAFYTSEGFAQIKQQVVLEKKIG